MVLFCQLYTSQNLIVVVLNPPGTMLEMAVSFHLVLNSAAQWCQVQLSLISIYCLAESEVNIHCIV